MGVRARLYIKGIKNVDIGALWDSRRAVWSHLMFVFVCFSVSNQVSAASGVQQNAATQFDREAPELFCGRPHFTRLQADYDTFVVNYSWGWPTWRRDDSHARLWIKSLLHLSGFSVCLHAAHPAAAMSDMCDVSVGCEWIITQRRNANVDANCCNLPPQVLQCEPLTVPIRGWNCDNLILLFLRHRGDTCFFAATCQLQTHRSLH